MTLIAVVFAIAANAQYDTNLHAFSIQYMPSNGVYSQYIRSPLTELSGTD